MANKNSIAMLDRLVCGQGLAIRYNSGQIEYLSEVTRDIRLRLNLLTDALGMKYEDKKTTVTGPRYVRKKKEPE